MSPGPQRRRCRTLTIVVVVAVVEVAVDVVAAVGRPPALGIRCAVPRSASIGARVAARVVVVDAAAVAGSGHCYCRCSEYC